MATLKRDIEQMYPGIFVMSVKVPGEGSLDDERKAGLVSLPSSCLALEAYPDLTLDWLIPLETVGKRYGSSRSRRREDHVHTRASPWIW